MFQKLLIKCWCNCLQKIKAFHSKLKERQNPNAYLGCCSLDQLAEHLECPVCEKVSKTLSYFQCKNGHLVCEGCFSKQSVCPVCRIGITRKIRPLSDEKAADARQMYDKIVRDQAISNRDLVEIFRCQTCLFVPTRKPIWICNKSHIICRCCMETRDATCLQCRAPVNQPLYRNLLAEKLLRYIPKPCRYENNGCTALIFGLNEHERTVCLCREAPCFVPTCSEDIPLTSYWDHLQEPCQDHRQILPPLNGKSEKDVGSLTLPPNYVNPDVFGVPFCLYMRMNYLQLNNNSDKFFLVCYPSHYHYSFFFWVHYIGIRRNANNFSFKLRLFVEGHPGQINVSGPVVSVEETYHTVTRSPYAFEITARDVREFWNQSTLSLNWEVSVGKKKAAEMRRKMFIYSTRS